MFNGRGFAGHTADPSSYCFKFSNFPGAPPRVPKRRAGSDLTTVAWRRRALPAAAVAVGVGVKTLSFQGLAVLRQAWCGEPRRRRLGGVEVGATGGEEVAGGRSWEGLPEVTWGVWFRLRGSRPCRLLERRVRDRGRFGCWGPLLGLASRAWFEVEIEGTGLSAVEELWEVGGVSSLSS